MRALPSFEMFGANGLSSQWDLGLLSDALGPLRSCFDFRGVIIFRGVETSGWCE